MKKEDLIKEELIYTDEKKYKVVLTERYQFATELNTGVEIIKGLPFLPPDYCPTLEVIRNPLEFWHRCILETLSPRKVNGYSADPGMLAKMYGVDYDGLCAQLGKVGWTAINLLEYIDGEFKVTLKVKQQIKEQCSVYGTIEQAKEFVKLDELLSLLNEFTDKYVTDRINMNTLADTLFCKYVQLPDKSYKLVPDRRALIHYMNRGGRNF